MAKATTIIKDKNFRVVIPQAIRMIEDLHIGDVVEFDIKKVGYVLSDEDEAMIEDEIIHEYVKKHPDEYKKIKEKSLNKKKELK